MFRAGEAAQRDDHRPTTPNEVTDSVGFFQFAVQWLCKQRRESQQCGGLRDLTLRSPQIEYKARQSSKFSTVRRD